MTSVVTIKGKDYTVAPEVLKLLDGDGLIYRTGGSYDGPKGLIFWDGTATLKKSDPDFEKIFLDMYDTTSDGAMLKDGIDADGLNSSLKQPK